MPILVYAPSSAGVRPASHPEREPPQPTPATAPSAPSAPSAEAAVRAALRLPCRRVVDIAAAIGVPRATLESYRLGTRRMPAATRARLATFLTGYAADLRAAAAALTAPADAAPADHIVPHTP